MDYECLMVAKGFISQALNELHKAALSLSHRDYASSLHSSKSSIMSSLRALFSIIKGMPPKGLEIRREDLEEVLNKIPYELRDFVMDTFFFSYMYWLDRDLDEAHATEEEAELALEYAWKCHRGVLMILNRIESHLKSISEELQERNSRLNLNALDERAIRNTNT